MTGCLANHFRIEDVFLSGFSEGLNSESQACIFGDPGFEVVRFK